VATTSYPVGTTAKTIADRALPGGASTLICPSTNTDTVWADSTQVAAAVGIPITPGSTQPWPDGTPLFAWSATNGQQLLVAPGVDQGTNAGAIATALLAQGLPAQIASQIALSGAPPIDQPAVLYTNAASPQSVPSGVAPTDTPLIDVTRYNFVEVWATELPTVAPTASWRHLTLNWYSDLAGTDRIHGAHYYYSAQGGMQGVKVPVPGGSVALKLTNTATTTTGNATLTYRMYGSTRAGMASSWNGNTLPASGFVSNESYGVGGVFIISKGAGTTGTVTDFPDIFEGPAVWNCAGYNIATGPMIMELIDLVDQKQIGLLTLPVNSTYSAATQSIILPRRPLWFRMTAQGNYNTFVSSLSMSAW